VHPDVLHFLRWSYIVSCDVMNVGRPPGRSESEKTTCEGVDMCVDAQVVVSFRVWV
jgi:hypothetical protein